MIEPNDFQIGPISAGALNAVKEAAFANVTVDGGGTHRGAFGKTLYPERPTLRIKARVFTPLAGGSHPAGGSDETGSGNTQIERLCPGRRVYAFQQQERIKCGQFQDNAIGYYGDGDLVAAFEQNNMLVKDDTIQTLELHMVWRDEDGELVEEWMFEAANGTSLPDDEGEGSGSGTDASGSGATCSGIPVNYCDANGNSQPACLQGQVILVDANGDTIATGF